MKQASERSVWQFVVGFICHHTISCFVTPLVEAATGGEGSGTRVIDFGRSVVMRYRNIQAKATAFITEDASEFSKLTLKRPQRKNSTISYEISIVGFDHLYIHTYITQHCNNQGAETWR